MTYYRIEQRNQETDVRLDMTTWQLERESNHNLWLRRGSVYKRVRKGARSQFACTTVEDAQKAFIARKRLHIAILKNQLEYAESALQKAQEGNWNTQQ